ncbi:Lysophospholipase 2 [Lasiodiplodia hormozganensis]|uniref:Lysophospholipase n=1 Tax=Lasiodiplodia hormozganensis TaxID=869390 RepID=A0AA39XTV5_9PEZI|nr:Lysophospholipase 2 [Lasiodiplodia hormozganensis]
MAPTTMTNLGALSLVLSATALAATSPYGPVSAACPASTALTRPASAGVNTDETSYLSARKPAAQAALASWLAKTNSAYAAADTASLPSIGLTVSGGGYRSMLTGAGLIQGLDARDSNATTAGLYQALSYQAGLSGGSWLLAALAGNDWPRVSALRDDLWIAGLQQTLFVADVANGGAIDVVGDLAAKTAAGFDVGLTDAWGRLLGYQMLYGEDGGVGKTLSGIADAEAFKGAEVPFPIITALGVKTWEGDCDPEADATQYEFTPYEFGSWDAGVAAFVESRYLGSELVDGVPSGGSNSNTSCVTGFDNLGFVFGTSSSLFNAVCLPVNINQTQLGEHLAGFVSDLHELVTDDLFALYPNPFYQSNASSSSLVAAQENLHLVDGGTSNQNNPIWPLLHRGKDLLDVLIVNDNSADTDDNWPNGTEIRNTWTQARAQLGAASRMPDIPEPDVFVAEGLYKRPVFFGCGVGNDTTTAAAAEGEEGDLLTILWVPNNNFTFASNVDTSKLQYSEAETRGMIANGQQVATQGGDARWPACLACGIMVKSGETLPDECDACLAEYCYN